MFIAKYCDAYGQDYWATGNSIDELIEDINLQADVIIGVDAFEGIWEASPVSVTAKTEYTIVKA